MKTVYSVQSNYGGKFCRANTVSLDHNDNETTEILREAETMAKIMSARFPDTQYSIVSELQQD